MGLSAFSRARVSMLPEMELEAKRFEIWNKAHQKSFRDLDDLHSDQESDEKLTEIREAMLDGVKEIGEKVVAGLQENTAEGDPIDMPLRIDHTRDLVGRRHVVDPQGEPQSIMDRLHDRIPTKKTKSEALVKKTSVDGDGPTKEEMDAAEDEQRPWGEEEFDDDVELPAAGRGAGVAGAKESVQSTERAMQPERGKPPNEKVTTGAAPHEKVVPKTTAAADVKGATKPADKEFKK